MSGADIEGLGIRLIQKYHMINSFTPQRIWKIQALDLTHSQVRLQDKVIASCTDALLGVFIVPVAGVWRVSFSLQSLVDTSKTYGKGNTVYIHHNQQRIEESEHRTFTQYDQVIDTGGRELITRAERGDTFHLETTRTDTLFWHIITCFEFVSIEKI